MFYGVDLSSRLLLGTARYPSPAVLVRDPRTASRTPSYFILLEWAGDRLVNIRDFRFARYAIDSAYAKNCHLGCRNNGRECVNPPTPECADGERSTEHARAVELSCTCACGKLGDFISQLGNALGLGFWHDGCHESIRS